MAVPVHVDSPRSRALPDANRDPTARRDSGRVLALAPSDNDVIYVGAGLGNVDKVVPGTALNKSSDGGATWTALSGGVPTTEDFNIFSITVSHSDPNLLYVGTNTHSWATPEPHTEGRGIFRSRDGGTTFQLVNVGLSETNILDLEIDPERIEGLPDMDALAVAIWPQDSNVILVGLSRNFDARHGQPVGGGVYASADGGATWTDVSGPMVGAQGVVTSLEFSADGTVLYAGALGGVFRGVVSTR